MHLIDPQFHSRRAFLRRSAQLAFTGVALPTALNLASMGEAAAFNAPDGSYKALVCVFMYGGNDYANTLVPYDQASYDKYAAIRTGISLPRTSLAATLLEPTAGLPDGQQYAFHPSMTGLKTLFNGGQAAVQLNVGPLVVPLTKAQYANNNRTIYPLPPKLFSHNDQQSVWQSSSPEGSTIGFGGNMGDLALSSNTNSLFTCISVTGNAVFLAGDSALAYQVGSNGAVKINSVTGDVYGSSAVKGAMGQLVQQARTHVLENEYNIVTRRAMASEGAITAAIGARDAADARPEFAPFAGITNNSLASQMKMVARLISARATLGAKRQVFFVSLNGFDFHDNLLTNHATNMKRVSDAMSAFYQTSVNLGVAADVTAFTASDFGRTLTSNGDGSDHGWGGHHWIVGGAVKGKAFYGTPPPVSVGSTTAPQDQWHVGQGRLLPSTAVDQYSATLAKWFGVEDKEMVGVLPNINRFGAAGGRTDYPIDLGFLRT
jgi:uncharacterized protein (DUF1501 family)